VSETDVATVIHIPIEASIHWGFFFFTVDAGTTGLVSRSWADMERQGKKEKKTT
jgi:hypothetical protein